MADDFDQLTAKAKRGDAEAQCRLADIYYDVFDEHFDSKTAFKWYKKSAELGNSYAMYGLGECYFYGRGVEESTDKAMKCYIKAAEMGNNYASLRYEAFSDTGEDEAP